jgi:anti-sigma B factor antagonist
MLKVELINNVYVASFQDLNRFNALVTEPVKEQLNNLFSKSGTKLVLNLQGIHFIDSSGFGVFLSVFKNANINYGYFKISNVENEVMELFKLLQLHNVFEIYSNLEDCIKSFPK